MDDTIHQMSKKIKKLETAINIPSHPSKDIMSIEDALDMPFS